MASQREVVLAALRQAGTEGVCISDIGAIDWTCVLTARNRVAELRAQGFDIESRPCLKHRHRGGVSRYFLRPKVAQLAML